METFSATHEELVHRTTYAITQVNDLNIFNATCLLQAITGIDKEVWFGRIAEEWKNVK